MKKKVGCFLALIFSALATGLCVSFDLPPWAEFISMILYLYVLFSYALKLTWRRAAAIGFLYFYVYYLAVWRWFLGMYLPGFTEISPAGKLVVVTVAWLGVPLLHALCAMWQVPLFALMARSRVLSRADGTMRMCGPFVYAAVYIVFEWAQTLTWVGVPWDKLAVGQGFVPAMIGSASLFGAYIVSFVVVSVNGCAAYAVLWAKKHDRTMAFCSLALGAVLLTVNLTVGHICMNAAEDAGGKTVRAAVLQGNILPEDKWRDDSEEDLFKIYTSLTEKAAADGAKLVIMPETAIPRKVNLSTSVWKRLEALSAQTKTTLIATGFWEDYVNDKDRSVDYNVAFAVSDDKGLDTGHIYKKHHLVPFGEFVPHEKLIRTILPPLAKLGMFEGTISAGEDTVVIPTDECSVGSLICFDSIYEDVVLSEVRSGAQILAVSTNDAWFNGTVAIYQHAAQSAIRAVECGRYVLRAGNTGLSCVIAPTGEVMTSLPLSVQSYKAVEVETRDYMTLYVRIGNVFVYVCLAVTAALAAAGCIAVCRGRKRTRPAEVENG